MSQPPRIEFPCAYPIKVMGENSQQLRADVLAVFAQLSELDPSTSTTARESAEGRYVSLTVTIIARSLEQLEALNTALRAVPGVKLLL